MHLVDQGENFTKVTCKLIRLFVFKFYKHHFLFRMVFMTLLYGW
jgi:hypothetical protein